MDEIGSFLNANKYLEVYSQYARIPQDHERIKQRCAVWTRVGLPGALAGASTSDTSLASLASLGAGCRRAIRRARRRNVCSGNAFFM